MSKITYFSVSDLTRFYHCIIKVSLRTNFGVNGVNDAYSHLPLAPAKVIWKRQYKNRLENTLSSAQCQFDIAQFWSTSTFGHDQLGVNATTQLSNSITTATRLVITPEFSGRRKKKDRKKWYDKNCFQLRNELNSLSRRLSKEPFNSYLRKAFIHYRRTYKQFLKTKEKEYSEKLKLQKDNPKSKISWRKIIQNNSGTLLKICKMIIMSIYQTQLNMRHWKNISSSCIAVNHKVINSYISPLTRKRIKITILRPLTKLLIVLSQSMK